jgi:hypothetical protein
MDRAGVPRDTFGKIFAGENVTLFTDDVKPYRNRKKKR